MRAAAHNEAFVRSRRYLDRFLCLATLPSHATWNIAQTLLPVDDMLPPQPLVGVHAPSLHVAPLPGRGRARHPDRRT